MLVTAPRAERPLLGGLEDSEYSGRDGRRDG